MPERAARRVLAVILFLFVGLGLAYAFTTPTLEAPDEIYHYGYIRSLVDTGLPPVLEVGGGRGFGHHAPLYYAVGALVSFWVGENDLRLWPERHNPFFGYRFGDVGRDNKNLYLHPDDDRLGASDTWLGIRVVRVLSVLMGAATLWVIYQIGREVFPYRPEMAVGAVGLAAFIPQFLFISAAVNDDNGASLFGALALWGMMRILRRGPTARRCVGLGVSLGLGWLSKLTTVALLPAAVLAVVLVALRRRSSRDLFRWGLTTLGVAALLILPWLVRQTLLYGDPTGTSREMAEWGLREQPFTLADLGPDLYWLRTSFWGRLGYNQIPLSDWIYGLLDLASLVALLGLVRFAVLRLRYASFVSRPLLRSERNLQVVTLAASFLFAFGPMVVRRFLRPMPNFGRYLFPVLGAIALLMFTGLATWLPRRRHSQLALLVTAAMLALGVAGLVYFLAPAYARPAIYDPSAAEPGHLLDWVYLEAGEGPRQDGGRPLARLRGYDLSRSAVEPGETLRVTLYWEALEETSVDYVVFVQLFGREGAKVGQRDTYPGLGHYPTSFWQVGQVIADDVFVPVNRDAAAPGRLRLDVGLYERQSGRRLAVMDGAGNPVDTATAGWLKLVSTGEVSKPAFSTDYRLGDGIALIGYDLEKRSDGVHLALRWASLASMERDYTVFVHLVDQNGVLMSQADGPPVGGDYPTSLWDPCEVLVDERLVPVEGLPPGTYRLNVGMYLLETGERLRAVDSAGARLQDDVVPLAEVDLP